MTPARILLVLLGLAPLVCGEAASRASDLPDPPNYSIVYVRVARPYPAEYAGINHLNQAGLHQTNAPGAELRLLHPDGRDESLVPVKETESITDPVVSFDGQWVFYAKFHHMARGEAHMSKLRSREGADIYKVHVATRKVVRLTTQVRTPNTGAIPEGEESHPRGVHNLAPCPVAGGKVVFVSDRNGFRGVRAQTQPALQLFVMDSDGSNVEHIGPLNLGTALHPVVLVDGRVMFSSLETQGLRSDERWGIWAIHPDGTNWSPLTSALGSPPGQAIHFQAQLSDQSIVVESYYQTGSTDGFGTFWKFPQRRTLGQAAFAGASNRFAPVGIEELTTFASFQDIRPNRGGDVSNRDVKGTVTHPSGAPDDHLLLTWAPPQGRPAPGPQTYDAGIYLMSAAAPLSDPSRMRVVKNDPNYQELWPKPLVAYKRIYGIDEPRQLSHRNDGKGSPDLQEGTPFGLVGSSSLYKRESYPNGGVPTGSVTARSSKPDDRKHLWRELQVNRFGFPGNWGEQGAEAGLYSNSDIWGVRILVTEPVSDTVFRKKNHFALGSNAEERLRILGEFPVRKFHKGSQPSDPDGNPDTSFLAKVPADVAWTFQTLDNNGMALNMSQTWHQLRPGEVRNNCGGCHAHSQKPTEFKLTAASKPDYRIWDLTKQIPLYTSKGSDQSKRIWDGAERTGVRFSEHGIENVEFYRDIKPILDRSCVACHTADPSKPGAPLLDKHRLVLDDYRPIERDWRVPWAENVHLRAHYKLPHTYVRLAQYSWAFQARRSPLIWKIYGKRLDGFDNDDIASPPLDYHDRQDVLDWCHHGKKRERDIDFTGSAMPPPKAVAGTFKSAGGNPIKVPPLSDEEKLTLARWIDLGCPIDLGKGSDGWNLDEGRPTLTLTHPEPGQSAKPLERILLGMHDYYSGLDAESLKLIADFEIDGIPAGQNLASKLRALPDSRWELRLGKPITELGRGNLTVSIRDHQGNTTRINRTFGIGPPGRRDAQREPAKVNVP